MGRMVNGSCALLNQKGKEMKFDKQTLIVSREKKCWSVNEATYQFRSVGLKVSHPTLKSWEDGKSEPNGSEIALLAKVYGKNPKDFFQKDEKNEKDKKS